jgi:hypothetical protein
MLNQLISKTNQLNKKKTEKNIDKLNLRQMKII